MVCYKIFIKFKKGESFMSKKCPYCGSKAADSEIHCPSCGNVFPEYQNQMNDMNSGGYNEQYQPYPNPSFYESGNADGYVCSPPYDGAQSNRYTNSVPPQQVYYSPTYVNQPEEKTGIMGWFGWILLCQYIPFLGVIITICIAKDPSVKNWGKARLIMFIVDVIIVILFWGTIISELFS